MRTRGIRRDNLRHPPQLPLSFLSLRQIENITVLVDSWRLYSCPASSTWPLVELLKLHKPTASIGWGDGGAVHSSAPAMLSPLKYLPSFLSFLPLFTCSYPPSLDLCSSPFSFPLNPITDGAWKEQHGDNIEEDILMSTLVSMCACTYISSCHARMQHTCIQPTCNAHNAHIHITHAHAIIHIDHRYNMHVHASNTYT